MTSWPTFSGDLDANDPLALADAYRDCFGERSEAWLNAAFVDYIAGCLAARRGDLQTAATHLQRVAAFSEQSGEPRPGEIARAAAAQLGISLTPSGTGRTAALAGPDFGPQFGPASASA